MALPPPDLAERVMRLGSQLLRGMADDVTSAEATLGLAAAIGILYGKIGAPTLDDELFVHLKNLIIGAHGLTLEQRTETKEPKKDAV